MNLEVEKYPGELRKLREINDEANSVLRSAAEITRREGARTDWKAFEKKLRSILVRQFLRQREAA